MCVEGVTTFPTSSRLPSPAVRTVGSMPRAPRAFVEGIYHLISHASDTRELFVSGEDRTRFIDRLALVIERFELRLVEYALLGNHYLVLGTPMAGSRKRSSSFTPGTRSRTIVVTADGPSLPCAPVRTRAEERPRAACRLRTVAAQPCRRRARARSLLLAVEQRRRHCGARRAPRSPFDHGPLRAALGDTDDWRRRYRAFIAAGEDTSACRVGSRR